MYSKELLEQVIELARKHNLIILSDEIYDKILYDGTQHISTASLADMNTLMRRIDLSCKVLAPTGVGLILGAVGDSARSRVFYGAAAVGLVTDRKRATGMWAREKAKRAAAAKEQ